ncbi:hypothetical protein ACFVUS_12695 [Nocardia sp. NPDC058058]|uniref:hypothetical protein n=1 Tax=Nocardia sp. NPDC058058 TaxID=3346317 RepID=UPI0036DD4449
MTNTDLPELPLGQPLRHHIANYLVKLLATMDLYDAMPMNMDGPKRLLSTVYEQLSSILEFHVRETELMTGSDRVGVQGNMIGDAAYVTVLREGEVAFEVPFTRDTFASFVASAQSVLAEMADPS